MRHPPNSGLDQPELESKAGEMESRPGSSSKFGAFHTERDLHGRGGRFFNGKSMVQTQSKVWQLCDLSGDLELK